MRNQDRFIVAGMLLAGLALPVQAASGGAVIGPSSPTANAIINVFASSMPQIALATPTPLTADIESNASSVQTACAQLRFDDVQLAISRATNDATAVTANMTAIYADRSTLRTARMALASALQTYLQPARDALQGALTAYEAAYTQLKADVQNNPGAPTSANQGNVVFNYTAVEAARAQLRADQQALAGAGATGTCRDDNAMFDEQGNTD